MILLGFLLVAVGGVLFAYWWDHKPCSRQCECALAETPPQGWDA